MKNLNIPVTFQDWVESGSSYPTRPVLYSWTRPSEKRDDMIAAGVILRVNGRWLFNPSKWIELCSRQAA